ncbi:WD repeat-containing protein 82-A-like [Zophobas morio]|uniref:WD repeat-containing protein 82-A-like n=1 Tax=Zophobas morio TaxID=2755281 RepID=UPI003082B984
MATPSLQPRREKPTYRHERAPSTQSYQATSTRKTCAFPRTAGSEDGGIYCWDLKGELVYAFEGHKTAIRQVRFNPKFMMVASAAECLAFWIPNLKKLDF